MKIVLCTDERNAPACAAKLRNSDVTRVECDRLALVQAVVSCQPDAVVLCDPGLNENEAAYALEFLKDAPSRPAYILVGENHWGERFPYAYLFSRMPDLLRIEDCVRKNREPQMSSTFQDEKDMELSVTEILMKLGIPPHIKGYRYLRSAVIMAVNDMTLLDSVTKELYPSVAKAFNTTASCVERAIRHAICSAWERGSGDPAFIEDHLRYKGDFFQSRPTNSELIALLSDSMRLYCS